MKKVKKNHQSRPDLFQRSTYCKIPGILPDTGEFHFGYFMNVIVLQDSVFLRWTERIHLPRDFQDNFKESLT